MTVKPKMKMKSKIEAKKEDHERNSSQDSCNVNQPIWTTLYRVLVFNVSLRHILCII